MKARPILFSGAMVRALLDGTKTQTRRIVKQKHLSWLENSVFNFVDGKWNQRPLPYGQPGDRLWVKEAWCAAYSLNNTKPSAIHPYSTVVYEATRPSYAEIGITGKLRPSIFMPRWASRITLEVTGVRVERLQDISEADAQAEGCSDVDYSSGKTYRAAYRALWEQINGPGSWDADPWVWVIEFRRIDGRQ